VAPRLDLTRPQWDQSTFEGRARHFFATTNPINCLASDKELDEAKSLVVAYRAGKEPKGTTDEQVWAAKQLYDSAFHPETGEKLFLPGRMSAQVPGNMTITGCMMTFYKTTPAVIFWQWANQSFNAVVNYTNRSASVSITNEQLGGAYAAATSAAMATALGLNYVVKSRPHLANGLVGRLVPFMAVAAANCVNIPLMRQRELVEGITVKTAPGEEGVQLGKSSEAAKYAIGQVVPSRILMAVPSMVLPPIVMSRLEKTKLFQRNRWLAAPATVVLTGLCLAFSTPLCCALFPQEASLPVSSLEPALQEKAKKHYPDMSNVYFNKGL